MRSSTLAITLAFLATTPSVHGWWKSTSSPPCESSTMTPAPPVKESSTSRTTLIETSTIWPSLTPHTSSPTMSMSTSMVSASSSAGEENTSPSPSTSASASMPMFASTSSKMPHKCTECMTESTSMTPAPMHTASGSESAGEQTSMMWYGNHTGSMMPSKTMKSTGAAGGVSASGKTGTSSSSSASAAAGVATSGAGERIGMRGVGGLLVGILGVGFGML